ncbi:PTS transporter subunit EIIC [Tolumonas osonensis]|uniref:PTS system D-glucosamine-specific IIC component/PTS system maltose and glucose-specific IIC component n=1 Tax=Tolumonas osonensis TaxID=675874 RepID=A0A841GJB0_9GAMM|nr:PTS transporter subunit EIIC [Tolumonas osonensis]MBB6054930.1 PTS system D-glucosamine-specific IIC component/PTS system maltose and glucose-specific IIC component [Tolumonas osonensis]
MQNSFFSIMQRVGRSFMLPIALLPVAGLMLGFGASFTNATNIAAYDLESILGNGTVLHSLLSVMKSAGSIIFSNLPILFAIGVAMGMAKKEKEVAAIAAAIGYFIMHATINAMLDLNGLLLPGTLPEGSVGTTIGIQSLQMGVFGGVIVGLGVSILHNKFYQIELPTTFSFFGGTRFIPIITAISYLFVGITMFFVWPVIQHGILMLGDLVNKSGYAGTFLYGFTERALIPFGLHHVFYMPFWQTGLGGTEIIDGVSVSGAQNIFFAELASHNVDHFSVEATRFMAGKFPFYLFGIPGAALALYRTAKPENRSKVLGLLLSATLTAILTGITEPIEFSFLFAAPLLYVLHCLIAGMSFMLCHIFNVGVGQTFSGSLIDFILFGVLQGEHKTSWLNAIFIGLPLFPLYYFAFSGLIKKFQYKTPGREDNVDDVKLYTRKDVEERNNSKEAISASIIDALGGRNNISDLDCCATRLRITVSNSSLVNEQSLKETGAKGVIVKGNGVQVIYGPHVSNIKSRLENYLDLELDPA